MRDTAQWLVRRWPTWLALAFVALLWGGSGTDLAGPLLILPLVYVTTVAIGRRAASWPVVIGISVVYTVLALLGGGPDPEVSLAVLAAAALAAGLVNRAGHRDDLWIQAAGMVVFGAVAFGGMAAEPDVAVWVVAAGWFAHGLWDAVHLWKDRSVSRTYAEACAVIDVLVAVQLVITR